jgi:hypothetical protein
MGSRPPFFEERRLVLPVILSLPKDDGDHVGGDAGQRGDPADEASLKLLRIQRGEHLAEPVMVSRSIGKGPEARQKIELVLPELCDCGERLGPGQHRQQGQQQDLAERVDYLAELPWVLQIREMIQKNNTLQE